MKINCLYFGKFGYTIVPKQIREDLKRIKSTGATSITLNILEQDYKAAFENIAFVIKEARQLGFKIYCMPDGWCALTENFSKFPSVFTVKNLDACIRNPKGDLFMNNLGPVADYTHPKTIAFFKKKLKECFKGFDFDGIFWHTSNDTHNATKQLYTKLSSYIHAKCNGEKSVFGFVDNSQTPFSDISYSGIHRNDIAYIDHRNFSAAQINELNSTISTIVNTTPKMICYFDYPPNVALPEEAMSLIKQQLSQIKSTV